jgi:hypothetical protein
MFNLSSAALAKEDVCDSDYSLPATRFSLLHPFVIPHSVFVIFPLPQGRI